MNNWFWFLLIYIQLNKPLCVTFQRPQQVQVFTNQPQYFNFLNVRYIYIAHFLLNILKRFGLKGTSTRNSLNCDTYRDFIEASQGARGPLYYSNIFQNPIWFGLKKGQAQNKHGQAGRKQGKKDRGKNHDRQGQKSYTQRQNRDIRDETETDLACPCFFPACLCFVVTDLEKTIFL